MTQDLSARILAFAHHIDDPKKTPADKALTRGWIAEDGAPTDEGRALVAALADQAGTRTLFRSVA